MAQKYEDISSTLQSYTADVVLDNDKGLHARPAAAVAALFAGGTFPEDSVYLHVEDRTANAKGMMGLLTLDAPKGTRVTIKAEGPNALELGERVYRICEDISAGRHD